MVSQQNVDENKLKELFTKFKSHEDVKCLRLGFNQFQHAILGVCERMERVRSPETFEERHYRFKASVKVTAHLKEIFVRLQPLMKDLLR